MTQPETYGECAFCHRPYAKSSMAQHLKTCAARKAADAALAGKPDFKKTKLFHLQIEARGLPQYWMHIEIPAHLTLYTLDGMLRYLWVECCEYHETIFQIDGKDHVLVADLDDDLMFMPPLPLPGDGDEDLTAEQAKQDLVDTASALGLDEDVALQFLADLEDKASKSPDGDITDAQAHEILINLARMMGLNDELIAQALPMLADAEYGPYTMDEPSLDKLIQTDTEFEYLFDLDEPTELTLTVVAERQGLAPEGLSTAVLARNRPPNIMCGVCGEQPATLVCHSCMHLDTGWMCVACALEHPCDEHPLPVLNSPRVGLCEYTGDTSLFSFQRHDLVPYWIVDSAEDLFPDDDDLFLDI